MQENSKYITTKQEQDLVFTNHIFKFPFSQIRIDSDDLHELQKPINITIDEILMILEEYKQKFPVQYFPLSNTGSVEVDKKPLYSQTDSSIPKEFRMYNFDNLTDEKSDNPNLKKRKQNEYMQRAIVFEKSQLDQVFNLISSPIMAKLIGLLSHFCYWVIFSEVNVKTIELVKKKQIFVQMQEHLAQLKQKLPSFKLWLNLTMPMILLTLKIITEFIYKNHYPAFFKEQGRSMNNQGMVAMDKIFFLCDKIFDETQICGRFTFFESNFKQQTKINSVQNDRKLLKKRIYATSQNMNFLMENPRSSQARNILAKSNKLNLGQIKSDHFDRKDFINSDIDTLGEEEKHKLEQMNKQRITNEDQEATSTMNTNDSSHAPVSNLSSESGYSNNSDGTTINFNDFDHQYQDQQYLDGQTVEVGNTQSFDAGTLITMRKNDKIYRKTEKLEEEKMFSSSSKNTSTKQNYDEDSREYNQLILGVQSGLSQSNNNNNLYNEEQQSVQENIEIPIQQITVLDQEYLGEVYNFGQGQENSAFYAPHSPQINQRRRSEDQFLIDLINMLGVDFSFKDGRKRKSKLKADLIRDVLNLVNKDFTFQNLNTFLSSNNNNQNNQQYLKYQRINQILNELNIESHSVCRRNLLQAFTALYSEKKSTVKLYNNYKNVRFLFKDANENQKGLQLIKETLNNQYSDSYCSMLHEVCQQAYCVWFTEFTEREFIPYLQLNYKRIAYPLGQREERVFMTKCVEYYYDKLFLSNIL